MRHYFDSRILTGVDDFYFHEQIQTIIKPCFYPRLCQILMKIIPVIKWVCACVKTSVEDDNFLREGWGCVNLMIFIWEFLHFGLTEVWVCYYSISVCRLRERGCMSKSKSVYVCVFQDLKLLRYVLHCAMERQLQFPTGMNILLLLLPFFKSYLHYRMQCLLLYHVYGSQSYS